MRSLPLAARQPPAALITALLASTLAAQETQAPAGPAITQHRFEGADPFGFTATAQRLPLRARDGTVRAHLFHVTYTRDDLDSTGRPLTFVYNGGPGSASLWLHLGALGPWRVPLDDDGNARAPQERPVQNPWSWLPFTDLVFIDPVGTGFSRPAEGHQQSEFSGYREDIESVGDAIAQITSRLGRWASPKYLCGESYGTLRSAAVSHYLQDSHGMFLSGIVLVSTVLDYGTKRFAPGHDLPYALHLPSFAATAHHHRALPPEQQQKDQWALLAEVERFALGDYLTGLAQGDKLSGAARGQLARRVAGYTGLSADFVLRADLRVDLGRFCKELLRAQGRTVGRLDSRFLGFDRDRAGERYEYDPSMANIAGPFTAAAHHLFHHTLGYRTELRYESLSGAVGKWSFKDHENSYVNAAEDLRKAMVHNPALQVLVLSGVHDLATPYFAADYTFSHMGLPAAARERLRVEKFAAGHMMYIHRPSLVQMTGVVRAFYGQEER